MTRQCCFDQNTFSYCNTIVNMTEINLAPDFFILNIIEKEFEAASSVFSLSGPVKHEGKDYYQGTISGPDGKKYSLVCFQAYDPGNAGSSGATAAILQHFKPKFFLLVGIAGGVKNRKNLELGDVVVSKLVKYYGLKKETKGKIEEIPRALANPSRLLLDNCRWVSRLQWYDGIIEKPEGENTIPKQISGIILSGDHLLADENSEFLKGLLEEVRKGLAVEMEGAGVAIAIYDESTHNKTEFLAIRGISDFCNESGNQDTRETWRIYSSTSAAMFTKKLMESTEIQPGENKPRENYLSRFDKALPQPASKEFNLKVKIVDGTLDIYSFLEELQSNRKVLLKGYAGGGKSEIVKRLATLLVADGTIPVIINLKPWNKETSEEFDGADTLEKRMKIILKYSLLSPSVEYLESFGQSYCLIMDGLNEVSGGSYGDETPRAIIRTLEDYLQQYQSSSIFMTDRLANREILANWLTGELLLVDDEEVKTIIDEEFKGKSDYDSLSPKNRDILKIPYYLDYVLKVGNPEIASEAKAHEEHFKNIGITNEELDELSKNIFESCEKTGGLSILQEDMEELEDIMPKLNDAGIISKDENVYLFDHQLKHEYLFSRYLSRNPSKWDSKSFDMVTLESNSPESIFMTLEQIEGSEKADEFLLKVYDWNWNISIKCMSIDSKNSEKKFSDGMTGCLLALLGIKKLDRVYGTSQSAIQSLESFESPIAKEIAQANDLNQLFEKTSNVNSEYSWFGDWKKLFLKGRDSQFEEDEINMIQSPISLIGWTATGVLKDSKLNEENQLQLRTIYRASNSEESLHGTRRWRIVHVLGRFPSEKNIELLFGALQNDEYHWVRYGAARSLLESAAICPELRKNIIEKITGLLPSLKPNIVEEIGKTVFHLDAGDEWKADVADLLQKAKDSQHDSSKGKWEDRIKEFEDGAWKG